MKTKMIQTIKKHKYLSLFILIIFLFLFVMIIIRGYHNCQPMLVLKKDVFEVEYGHPISQNPLDYVPSGVRCAPGPVPPDTEWRRGRW